MFQGRQPAGRDQPKTELTRALGQCRRAFLGIGLMTAMINVLYLTGSFFMLEVYDRVIPGRSVPTLVGLAILACLLYGIQGVLDMIRGRVLVRIGSALDEALSGRIYDIIVRLPLKTRGRGDGLQALRDLDQIRSFLSGLGPTALFDLPWMPLYLAICFLFHPWLGLVTLGGAVILVTLTILTEVLTRGPSRRAVALGQSRTSMAEAARRNAEVLQAMGMRRRIRNLWGEANAGYQDSNRRTADVAGGFGAMSKVLRMVLQSAVLAVGAYLVIQQQATAGIMIAASILASRALAPAELAIANWRGFVGARSSWKRLQDLLVLLPEQPAAMALPAPCASLSVESAAVTAPGGNRLLVQDVSLAVKAGSALGVIGPSASGKSSFARMIMGIWPAVRGKVRLDGAALEQWDPEALGPSVGYLPQDVELFAGTVSQNIARFDPEAKPEAIIAAARAAGVHELVLRLPEGYETEIGESGHLVSAGQRQRIALARALYGDPFLVVLDEPNSNLDNEGEQALTAAILGVRQRGGLAVVIAHRPSALAGVDLVLVLAEGRMQAFGPKDEILAKILRPAMAPAAAQAAAGGASGAPLRVVQQIQGAQS